MVKMHMCQKAVWNQRLVKLLHGAKMIGARLAAMVLYATGEKEYQVFNLRLNDRPEQIM